MNGKLKTAVLALMFALAAPARAATCSNPIVQANLPCTISTGGNYTLAGNIDYATASGVAIEITTGSVTLDLAGYRLGMAAAGTSTTAVGVQVAANKKNVIIRNGMIRGAYKGVEMLGASSVGALVERLVVDLSRYRGIEVDGAGAVVRDNVVSNTGGSTVSTPATGILVVSGTAVVERNVVSVADTGIDIAGEALVAFNRILTATAGISFSGSGKYANNLTAACTTPFTGGTDAGGNN